MLIACVDDERSALMMYKLHLKDHDVRLYQSPEVFLLDVEELKPDLIFLDMVMPYMCGSDVLIRLKQNSATKDIPVIVVTGLTGEEYEILAKEYNAVGFINKGDPNLRESILKWI